MCAGGDHYEKVCKGEFASMHTKLDRMDEAIRGNGKPGIQLRLDRLESAAAKRSKVLWMVLGSVVTLAVAAGWRLVAGA